MDILITGATGNVGAEVLRALAGRGHRLFAGVRDPGRARLPEGVSACAVDLATGTGPARAFDAIFLMRPPQIADPAPFRRFLAAHDRGHPDRVSLGAGRRAPQLPAARQNRGGDRRDGLCP